MLEFFQPVVYHRIVMTGKDADLFGGQMKKISLLLAVAIALTMFLCACKPTDTDKPTEPATDPATEPGSSAVQNLYDIKYNYKDHVKTIADYKGLEIDMNPEPTEEQIREQVEYELQYYDICRKITDRAVKEGDTICVEFTGYMNGEKFEGGYTTTPMTNFVVGGMNYIDGFEDGLIGAVPSEDKTVDLYLKFPEDYGDEEFNGKDVLFKVTVHYIAEPLTMDSLTLEDVRQLSEDYTSVEEYIDEVRESLKLSMHQDRVNYKRNYLFAEIVENSEFSSYPQELYDYYYDYLVDRYRNDYATYSVYYQYNGINSFDEYLAAQFGSSEKFYEQVKESAENSTEIDILCAAITDIEHLELTDEEYISGVENYLSSGDFDSYGFENAEDFIEYFTEAQIRYALQNEKVLDFVAENSVEKTS